MVRTSPDALSGLVASTQPIDFDGELLDLLPEDDPTCWIRHGDGLVGWGAVARLQVRGVERFARTQRWWAELTESLLVEDSVSLPGTGPIAFASFAFDQEEASDVVVPTVVVGRRSGQTWMTVIHPADQAPDFSPLTHPLSTTRPRFEWSDGALSAPEWEKAVSVAVERIAAGEFDKVVLARDIIGTPSTASERLDPRTLLHELSRCYPSCWTFNVSGLVGATPELLVRRTGDLVTSRVLAGTVHRIGDEATDAGLALELLDSHKDLAEHGYAVGSVARALAMHCTDLEIPESPRVLALANVHHLATDITGRLADDAPLLALAASLHPTAAVCGTPTGRALSVIAELESMSRGRYAGPVGWFDIRGEGEFGIALRCAELDSDSGTVRAFAGCGIVSGSDPAREVTESDAKLLPIRTALS